MGRIPLGWSGIAIHKDINEDCKLYHYYTMENFIKLYNSNRLHLTKIYNWDDPWELPYRFIDVDKKYDFAHFILNRNNLSLKNDVFNHYYEAAGFCFTKNEDCEFMWKNYAHSYGVCVETTARDVIESVKDNKMRSLFIAPVKYFDIKENTKEILLNEDRKYYPSTTWMGYIKRMNYAHENEVRMIVVPAHTDIQINDIRIDLDKYINRIILYPDICDKECDCNWEIHEKQRIELFRKDFPKLKSDISISNIYKCKEISIDDFESSEECEIKLNGSSYPKGCKMIYIFDNNGDLVPFDRYLEL